MPSRPFIRFYPDSWMSDVRLRQCCRATRATWMDLLCLMHQGVPYGHLSDESGLLAPKFVATWCEVSQLQLSASVEELDLHGVFSRTDSGAIFSRRMVKDETTRSRRAKGGGLSVENPNVPRPKDTLEGYPSTHNIGEAVKDTPIAVAVVVKNLISKSEWPELTKAIQAPFPSTDGVFILRIAQESIQGAISDGIDPDLVTDHALAQAVQTSMKTDNVKRAGLLLKTVPQIIRSWGKQER